jgi:hypothetical protein
VNRRGGAILAAGALAVAALACGAPAHGDDVAIPDAIKPLLEAHCVDCHEGSRAKGGLELAGPIRAGKIEESVLRALRRRLAKRDMPPADEPVRPSVEEYRSAVAAIDASVPPTAREVAAVRRLNRAQYDGAVRDVLASTVDVRELLPRDEIGEGFDTNADTLVLPPLLLENYFDCAEKIAASVVPDDTPMSPKTVPAERFERRGQGHANDGFAWLSTNGTLVGRFTVPRAGRYRLTLELAAQQAGEGLARAALLVDGEARGQHAVAGTTAEPTVVVWEGTLAAGEHRAGARFLNDHWDPKHPDPSRRDRNLAVGALRIEGPLDPVAKTPFAARAEEIAGEGTPTRRLMRVALAVGEELFRRPLTNAEAESLARVAREAAEPWRDRRAQDGARANWAPELRALVTALLVDPRFLLRIEKPCVDGESRRALDGHELASRLSFFLWSSVPDAELRRAAAAGELDGADGVRVQARRMLGDPRASSLATRFAAQWLGIDALEQRSFDPARYPELDAPTLVAMREETERLFARIVRGDEPVRALLLARETEIDARLARVYGVEAPAGGAVARLALPPERPSGVLGHASILVATSNPTRTSPVKRGKWVLEAMLDEAPPPPPPGVPQLPEEREEVAGRSIRELMALHRDNPDCASCHVRMDAIGLAFEALDVDGRLRSVVDGLPVDDSAEMPDGSILRGAAGVADLLLAGQGFERSLARRLLVYALGRGTADADDALVDRLASELAAKGDFVTLVEGIVSSDAFRTRTALRQSAGFPLPREGRTVE